MKRRGIEAITTYQHPSKRKAQYDHIENTDLLTAGRLDWQRDHSGFEGDIHILSDPLITTTSQSIAGDIKVPSLTQKHLPTEVVTKELPTTEEGNDMETMMLETVRNMVGKKIADLSLLPFEKIRMDQTLDDFGMDSMLAAEFRTYISRALEVDIPFRMLLDKNTTVDSISEVVCANLKKREMA